MTWSSTSILRSWPARIRSRVTLMSASEGVGSPLGWLCYVQRRFIVRWRLLATTLTQDARERRVMPETYPPSAFARSKAENRSEGDFWKGITKPKIRLPVVGWSGRDSNRGHHAPRHLVWLPV